MPSKKNKSKKKQEVIVPEIMEEDDSSEIPIHLFVIFDMENSDIYKVSIDPEDIELEMSLLDEERYAVGQFDTFIYL